MKTAANRFLRGLGRAIAMSATLLVAGNLDAFAVDDHIDPAANAGLHNLTFARHVNTAITAGTLSTALQSGSNVLKKCDSRVTMGQDVACQVTLGVSGSVGTFGTAMDGLDVITTDAEMNMVIANAVARVKVVTSISACGGVINPSIIGCGYVGASGIVSESGLGNDLLGLELVHEFGHNQGMNHRGDAGAPPVIGNPIMQNPLNGRNEVDLTECNLFHSGSSNNGPIRPVDVGFVIDDTGSMFEEIDGVRQALLNHLATYPANSCNAFQLTTFKDDVTPRDPTTDLTIIQGQVSGLFASGGGDCPEASVEALNQASDKVVDAGRILIATDADPHPGLDLAATIAALRARGLRVDIVLSSTCFGTASAVGKDNAGFVASSEPREVANGAVDAYSQIASATGGIFAFVPGVNTGEPGGSQRFTNTIFNIVQGGITRSIGLVEPPTGPVGGAVIATLTGASTNFRPGAIVEIAGGDVAVSDVHVISPIQLEARLDIAPGAVLGFRDVQVTVDLGGGTLETALGVGAFEVVSAPAGPTIISMAPASGSPGDNFPAVVTGLNTNFTTMASMLDLGAGVTATDLVAITPQTLQATVHVDGAASIGFRTVSVTTSGEFAARDLGFLVSARPPALPQLLSTAPASGTQGQTVSLAIEGQNTHFETGLSILSFSGTGLNVLSVDVTSPTTLSAELEITPDAPPGFRDVIVTTGVEVATLLGGFLVEARSSDTEPPMIHCPDDIVVDCDAPGGKAVMFEVTATDNLDPAPVIVCVPPSGSTFPIGTTHVVCTARDAAGNESTCGFDIDVRPSNCPHSKDYWRHADPWPVMTLMLGTVPYDRPALLEILRQGDHGDPSRKLGKQLIAAKLNLANCADPVPILATIAQADALIGSRTIPIGVRAGSPEGKLMKLVAKALEQYNKDKVTRCRHEHRIHSPAAGSVLVAGRSIEVTWDPVDDPPVQSVELFVSFDDGVTWSLARNGLPNTGRYDWTVPSSATTRAMIKVVFTFAADEEGVVPDAETVESDPFTIVTTTAVEAGDATLALRPMNPVIGPLTVSFTLATGAPASLGVFDVGGRQVLSREIASSGPGWHTVRLGTLPSGVYLIRLSQAGRVVSARAAVIH